MGSARGATGALVTALLIWSAPACAPEGAVRRADEPPAENGAWISADPSAATIGPEARSDEGMVVSGSIPATLAGAEILAAGGNAADAAVATAFALAVAEPTQSGLGGRTQALVRTASGETMGVDATTEVPATYPTGIAPMGEFGWAAVGIPGTVRGLATLHAAHGRLAWSAVMAPAIRLAEEGFEISEGEAERIASAVSELSADAGARTHFLRRDGTAYAPGDRLVQPVLARTLRMIAQGGPEAFYTGEIGDVLAREIANNGGFVTDEDLRGYEARPSIVVRGRYREHDLIGTYLPASGATTIETLQILEHFDLASMPSAERVATVSQALLLAFRDREDALGPAADDARRLTSPGWARDRAAEIVIPTAPPAGAARTSLLRGADSVTWMRPRRDRAAVGPRPASSTRIERALPEPAHTTHVSVVDADGMAVSMTQSLGPTGGARVASMELGFLFASTMGYLADARPGDRPWSSQSPLIVERDGGLAFVLGGAGARRIISALLTTMIGLVDDRLPLGDAMAAPRFHPSDGSVYLESGDAGLTFEAGPTLEAVGLTAETREAGTYFARLNAIERDTQTGALQGVADPRWPWSGASGPARR
jgi:gamma-glutamyltranspeptidase/glutathione hydrolase